ncbi:MAG: RNA-splicing factor [Ramalina farinacea]|uniref:Pre-mRNA-splicing factor CWC24 n=1 Tax=Ramalina farinacea TaxID=258253 RepID=A0AA43TY82_9LECA|nr:RNA-splicing factor [Ramalina farinacea]
MSSPAIQKDAKTQITISAPPNPQPESAPPPPPPASDSDGSGYTSTEGDESGQRIKRRKKSAIVTATSANPSKSSSQNTSDIIGTTNFSADRSTTIAPTNDATKQSNWYDEKALLGTTRSKAAPATLSTATTNNTSNSKSGAGGGGGSGKHVGPVKAPTNVRTITVTDFAPDVCKDYKQTGFCGFGDSCKFLHAREDYKQGWELDKEWEKVGSKTKNVPGQRRRRNGEEVDEEEEEDALLETIPFACIICKEGYKQPIVTKCGHYFCEGCALGRYRKNPNCAACGAGTNGVFNGAKQLKKLLERKRERARKRREKAKEEGEEVSEDEEGEGEGGE